VNWKETTKQISSTSSKMRKFYSNPKSFKHDGKGGIDSERGGNSSKKDSEVKNIVKQSSETYLQTTH